METAASCSSNETQGAGKRKCLLFGRQQAIMTRLWGALQSRGVTGGGEGVVAGVTLFSSGRQRVSSCRIQDPADFCRKMAAVFGAEVYRKSTGVSSVGKYAVKDSACE